MRGFHLLKNIDYPSPTSLTLSSITLSISSRLGSMAALAGLVSLSNWFPDSVQRFITSLKNLGNPPDKTFCLKNLILIIRLPKQYVGTVCSVLFKSICPWLFYGIH